MVRNDVADYRALRFDQPHCRALGVQSAGAAAQLHDACPGPPFQAGFDAVVLRNQRIENIFLRPGIRTAAVGEGQEQRSAGFEDSQHLPDGARAISQRIDHTHAHDRVEKTMGKRKTGSVAGDEMRPRFAGKPVPADSNHPARGIHAPELAAEPHGFSGHNAGAAAYVENPAAGPIEEAHNLFTADAKRVTGGRFVLVFAIVVARSGIEEPDYGIGGEFDGDFHFAACHATATGSEVEWQSAGAASSSIMRPKISANACLVKGLNAGDSRKARAAERYRSIWRSESDFRNFCNSA